MTRGGSAYWTQSAEALFAALGASPDGLSSADAALRLRRDGPNLVHAQQVTPALMLLIRQFRSPLVLILVFAGLIAGALREWIDAAIILAMVLGSTLLGFAQEHRASRAVAALRQRLALTAKVRRDGKAVSVPMAEVVAGDVVLLSAGAVAPADGVVLSARDLLVSQAALTGESFPVEKQPGVRPADTAITGRDNCVYMGSSVRSGSGEVLVVATGRATAYGEIAEQLKSRPDETDFARGVRRFGLLLLRIMVGIVLFVMVVNQIAGRPFVDSLLFSVALGLGMSPELLPAIISVTLSAGAVQLARKGVIVRQLEAIENLGGMTVFCTDKTGTLTEGRIEQTAALDAVGRPSPVVQHLGYLNAAFETGIANPLDEAILANGRAAGLSTDGYRKLDEIPYDFTRKRLSIVVAEPAEPDAPLMIVKGAFEGVLARCTTMQTPAGLSPLDTAATAKVRGFHKRRSRAGLRLLAVASRRLAKAPAYGPADEADLVLQGFLVFLDPPKPEAITAVDHLASLGVAVKVVSGDNRYVVRSLADRIGLKGVELITGDELARLEADALAYRAERATLFAEVEPQQKERIVRALQQRGHSVGYLGDGINDAPALMAADVGVSVDQAVDVARESADVVLLQRDLDLLSQGVLGGRRTFANTLKYISITTSANFGNMVSMAVATPWLPFLPMAAKQILLNNLLSDLPSMAISTDAVDEDQLVRARRMDVGDIQRFMLVFGLISSAFDLLTFALLIYGFRAGEALFQSAWFVLSVITELAVVASLRTHGPAWKSRPSVALAVVSGAVGAVALALPYTGAPARLFSLIPLDGRLLGGLALLILGYLTATELAKVLFFRSLRRRPATDLHQGPRRRTAHHRPRQSRRLR